MAFETSNFNMLKGTKRKRRDGGETPGELDPDFENISMDGGEFFLTALSLV